MKSRILLKGIFTAAIVFVASPFTPVAHAQEGQEITVTIPFEFSVNRLHFEAGPYKFDQALDKFGMSVINLQTGKKQFIPARPQNNSLSPESGFLIFKQTDGNQYLSEVHFPGAIDYSRLKTPQTSIAGGRNTILQGALRR